MPTALTTALAAPLRELLAMVGPGWSADRTAEPGAVLAGVRDALTSAAAAGTRAWNATGAHWHGAGADAAARFSAATTDAIDGLAVEADRLAAGADEAGGAVARANARLRAIVEDFERRAEAVEADLDAPGAAERLLADARTALTEAIAVLDELTSELDRHAASATAATPPARAADPPGAPAAGGGGAFPSGGLPGLGTMPGPGALPATGALPALAGLARRDAGSPSARGAPGATPGDPRQFGDGEAVRLPDGTTVSAPNAVAASAVRHALTQLGVPYDWGGTTPGVGLDCSGLTQWAYGEAGLSIPRLAQEQDVGAAVGPGGLRPGDLAVWDGHVAMVVGDGTMIEAGDPVQLSPVRTTNAGQGFHGFFRPTA
ncbi:MAG: C40 family peptidase [Actinobacteria bacterium]|nr:C40 family peptidase [Actinomycetota bacterium]